MTTKKGCNCCEKGTRTLGFEDVDATITVVGNEVFKYCPNCSEAWGEHIYRPESAFGRHNFINGEAVDKMQCWCKGCQTDATAGPEALDGALPCSELGSERRHIGALHLELVNLTESTCSRAKAIGSWATPTNEMTATILATMEKSQDREVTRLEAVKAELEGTIG